MDCSIRIKSSAVDIPIYFTIIIFFLFFLSSFDYSSANAAVVSTFFINGIYFLVMTMRPQKSVSMKRNYYIFNLIFMFFAPLQQYLDGTHLWKNNGLNIFYKDDDYLKANILIFTSSLLFELGYYFSNKQERKNRSKNANEDSKIKYMLSTNTTYNLLVFFSLLCSIIVIITDGFQSDEKTSITRQISNMIIFVPPLCWLISMMSTRGKISYWYKFVFAINSIWTVLGYSDSITRFILLGAIMMIVSFKLLNSKYESLYLLIYIFGFFFAFSLVRFVSIQDIESLELVDFRQNDYDAYQMFMMTMRYVEEKGISWGMNIASALFCFIPRSFATWRFESTGEIVIDHYGSWFTNVSNPMVSEMYFAFGVIGVIALSVAVGFIMKKIDLLSESNQGFKCGVFSLISGLSAYLYRGALLATFSYTFGLLIAFFCLYKFTHMQRKSSKNL